MKKFKKLPFKLMLVMIFGIILTISVGLSIWLITDQIEIKPQLDVNKVITQYLDELSVDYLKDTVSLPSNSAVGLEYGSEDLTYYYKLKKDSDGNDVSTESENKDWILVEGSTGPMNAGTYSILIEYLVPDGVEPVDPVEVTFTINKAKINMEGITFDGEELTYDKNHHNIIISGTLPKDKNGNTVITNVIYTCDNKTFTGATDAGTYNVTASFVYDENNYETVNPINATLKINPKSISLSTWEFEGNPNKIFYHTGSEIGTIKSSLIVTDDDNEELKENTHYTISFSDLVNLGTSHTFTVTGKGNYTGTISGTYIIKEKVFNLIVTPNNPGNQGWQTVAYNGKPQRPSVTVKDVDGNIISDATIKYYIGEDEIEDTDMVNQGRYSVTVIASKDGYTDGNCAAVLLINPVQLSFTWSNDKFTYDKNPHNPTLSVTGIVEGDSCTVQLSNPQVDAGGYTARAALNDNTYGNYTLPNNFEHTFTISPRSVTLESNSYAISYNSSYRTWTDIKSITEKELKFDNVIDGDTLGASISGMHNGVYSYGTVSVNDLETTTNVVGSTYQATISISNKNYTMSKNTFILKYKTAIVNGGYFTVEDAFAQTGTISFFGDATSAASHVVTCFTKLTAAQGNPYNKAIFNLVGRTLLIPFENSLNLKHHEKGNPASGNVYSALIVPKGITINVTSNGSITAGAKIGYNQSKSATIASSRGVLINHGTIICGNGTKEDVSSIKAYGYIKGDGEITINKFSRGYENMSIYDFAGGTAAMQVQSNVIPMNSWSMHNNSCKTKIMSGAEYYGFVFLELSIVGGVDAEFYAIGSKSGQNCIFIPSSINDNTYVVKYTDIADEWKKEPEKYTDLDTITGSNQLKGQKDVYELYGSYLDSSFKISVSLASLSTAKGEDKPCPISFMDLIIKNGGSFTVTNSDYLFLPGTSCTVENGATLTIGKGVHATFAPWEDINTLSGGFNTRCIDKKDAELIVKGTLNVLGQISGKITAGSSGAVFTIGNEAKLTTSANTYNDNPVGTVSNIKPSATANILDGELSINASYVSEEYASAPEGEDKYWWRAASSIKYVKIILYDNDGTTELDTIIIQVVNSDTYIVAAENFTASKLHYKFNSWLTMDDQAFSTATLQAVTKEELETSSSYEPLKLKAVWDLQDYHFTYLASYGLDEYGNLNYLTEENGLIINNKVEGFTIDSFENGIISIPTTAEYSVGDSVKFMNGWYIGIDKSTGIKLSSLSREQFEAILEELNGETTISLYCEFTDNEYFNVVITDDKHQDKVISQGYLIEDGYSISSSGNSIPTFDTSNYDDDPNTPYYFNGFIDTDNNVYTLEELQNLPIESDMIIKVNWSNKVIVSFSDGINEPTIQFIKPNKDVILEERPDYESKGDNYNTKKVLVGWKLSGEEDIAARKAGTTFNVSSDIEFIAVYETKYTYVLTINVDNAYFTIGTKDYSSKTEFYYDVAVPGEQISITYTANTTKDKLKVDGNEKTKPYTETLTISSHRVIEIKGEDSGTCLAEGTLITMNDGTKRAVEDLRKGDLVMAFDHLTGEVTFNKVIIVVKTQSDYYKNTFVFDDGTELVTINEHGIYDLDLNKYVNIDHLNYLDYLGHRFVSIDVNGNISSKVLVDVKSIYESGYKYDIVTNETLNYVAEDTLSVTHVLVDVINTFEFDENMKYDQEKMMQDINKYGLYEYDEWSEYCDIKVFEEYNIPIMKVGISKGLYTKEYIIGLINTYVLDDSVQITSD